MHSTFPPPIFYVSDDDDEDDNNGIERNNLYARPIPNTINDHFPHQKRKLTDANVRINPSITHWSKRQRHDNYQRSQQTTQHFINDESDPIVNNSHHYSHEQQNFDAFHAFDWTAKTQPPARRYSNSFQTPVQIPTSFPTMMDVANHRSDQLDKLPSISRPYQNGRYSQQFPPPLQRKPVSILIPPSSLSVLPLPLPKPTSSFIRSPAQHVETRNNIQNPYTYTSPPLSFPVHHPKEQQFLPSAFHPLSPVLKPTPITTPEIRRQPLNGAGILFAFYDSVLYQCNICKFQSSTSAVLLQHLFTHVFFCHDCSFYTHSNYTLQQHVFEKHTSNLVTKNDPKNLELLHITRCPDGTFALCMDSSVLPASTKTNEEPIVPPVPKAKVKVPRKRSVAPKKKPLDPIIPLTEKRNENPPPASSSSTIQRPAVEEKAANVCVLMKHRRCYSIKHPPCLHSLTLEYNICREHTIRHVCHTQGLFNRRKWKGRSKVMRLIDEVAHCMKTTINQIVDVEENSASLNLVCALPNNIIGSIFSNPDWNMITSCLKLKNKYDRAREQNQQYQAENSIRASNHHSFMLSACESKKTDQITLASLQTAAQNTDSMYTQTRLNKLRISSDNTHRFLKGNLHIPSSPINHIAKTPIGTPATTCSSPGIIVLD